MSFLKISPDLALGKQELMRFQDFMSEKLKTFIQVQTKSFGMLLNDSNVIGNNFLVELGTNAGTIKIANKSYALDGDSNMITKRIEDNIVIPNDSNWYWLRISYLNTNIEEGIVEVDNNGNLTGVDTLFTEVLRGQPDFPSKIKFEGASLNLSEYEIVDVISDTTAILAGVFSTESDLRYKVVGTFTPGISIDENKKYPFNYDSCKLEAVLEVVVDTPPAKTGGADDYEFYIARVRNSGGTVTIQDKRTEFYQLRFE